MHLMSNITFLSSLLSLSCKPSTRRQKWMHFRDICHEYIKGELPHKGLKCPKRLTNLPWGLMSSILNWMDLMHSYTSPGVSQIQRSYCALIEVCENPYLSKSHQDWGLWTFLSILAECAPGVCPWRLWGKWACSQKPGAHRDVFKGYRHHLVVLKGHGHHPVVLKGHFHHPVVLKAQGPDRRQGSVPAGFGDFICFGVCWCC